MQLPSKLQHGENFKTGVVNKINSILDYLKTQRLVSDNKTIKINQFTSRCTVYRLQAMEQQHL